MDTDLFLRNLRDLSLEEGKVYIQEHILELSDHQTVGEWLADEALRLLYTPFLSLKIAELLIFFGTFLRGPNWSFFGPYQFWDLHKQEALNNQDISNIFWNRIMHTARPTRDNNPVGVLPFWLVREWLGFILVAAYFLLVPVLLAYTVFRRMYENMGGIRYSIMVILLLFMAMMPIKMVLRWLFNMKYFIFLPEFNANL